VADGLPRVDVELTQTLAGDASVLAAAFVFPVPAVVPATATVTGQALALDEGTVAAEGGAMVAITGQALSLSQGAAAAVVPGALPTVIPHAGPARRPRRALLGPADVARLFPEPPAPEPEPLPVVIAATATVRGVRVALQLGRVQARGAATAAARGTRGRTALGSCAARGIHNPTDEEILAWLAAA
jgi:hypothetical protein